jgi:Domain of unknown function (DUF4760)
MSLELVNTLATFGTFVVIAATAIAAIVQLRHARSSNQIAALNELRETMESADFDAANQFVMMDLSATLQEPAFRHQIAPGAKRSGETRALRAKMNKVANFYESMGMLVKAGLVDQNLVVEMWSDAIIGAWNKLAPFTAIGRRSVGDGLLENFEYLTVLSQDWLAAHPKGTYPAGVRRIGLKDEWLEADKQYAASLAPA